MFRQDAAATNRLRSGIVLASAIAAAIVGLLVVITSPVSALSNHGPDPADLGSATDNVGYIITSPNYGPAQIPSTRVPIYFPKNTDTYTVEITDGNLCTDPRGSAPDAGGNVMDTIPSYGSATQGASAALFSVLNQTTGLYDVSATSVVSSDNKCYDQRLKLTFSGASLKLDPISGLYFTFFRANTLNGGTSAIENRFSIKINTDGIVGYSASVDSSSFALGHNYPQKVERDYAFPFAPDCSVTAANTPATAQLYDLDNGTAEVQNNIWMESYIEEIRPDGSKQRIPLTFTRAADPASTPIPSKPGSQPNTYIVESTTSKEYVYVHMKVQPGNKYKMGLTRVYGRNILQFKLPFDSIFFVNRICDPVLPPPPVTDKPYFEAKGGDVMAGSSFAHEKTDGTMVPCSSSEAAHNTNAGIVGQIRQPDYAGAGGEYAAFAWNRIQDFRTSKANTAGPAALSFANKNPEAQVNLSAGMFGGMFASAPCVDYWASKPAVSTMTVLAGTPATPVDVGSIATGTYYRNGDLIIAGDSKVINKKRVTIYVNGNVAIQSGSSGHGVVYGGGSDTNWSSYDEIPAFKLVVRGSIFINAGVTHLDGQYVAVPTENYATAVNTFAAPLAGTISTCANGFTTYKPADAASGMINACSKQLIVNGSMSANQIWLLRTGGTIGSGLAAEIIQYGPENWLISPTGGSLNPEYDAVIGLPPIL